MAGMTKAVSAICIKSAAVAGASANTNMAITGITTDDVLISVIEIATSTGIPTDRTSTTSITSAGNIQCTVDTSSDKLIVLYHDTSA